MIKVLIVTKLNTCMNFVDKNYMKGKSKVTNRLLKISFVVEQEKSSVLAVFHQNMMVTQIDFFKIHRFRRNSVYFNGSFKMAARIFGG